MRILVADDEVKIAEAIAAVLNQNGFDTHLVDRGDLAYFEASKLTYDLIILDVMMPGMDGFEVVRKLRDNKIYTPIMMLTAKDGIEYRVLGLDLGANDYLSKPFSMEELVARVRALTRNYEKTEVTEQITYGDLILNTKNLTFSYQKETVKLSTLEYNLAYLFMLNPDKIISKDEINQKVWNNKVDYSHIEIYISFLRKKLQRLNSDINIVTIRGLGYRLGAKNA